MGENAKGSAATVSGTPRSLISLKSIEKPCKSRTLQKETGHQSRYALYQNWCPVMVRETGLEPVRCEPHAPQTCASASSATLALRRAVARLPEYYISFCTACQPLFFNFLRLCPSHPVGRKIFLAFFPAMGYNTR